MVPRVLQKVFTLVQVFAHRRLDVDEAALPADVALVGRIDDLAHLEPRRRARARPVAVELAEIELDVDPEVDPRLPHDVGDVLELPRRVRAAVDRDDGLAAPLQQAVEAGVVEMATVAHEHVPVVLVGQAEELFQEEVVPEDQPGPQVHGRVRQPLTQPNIQQRHQDGEAGFRGRAHLRTHRRAGDGHRGGELQPPSRVRAGRRIANTRRAAVELREQEMRGSPAAQREISRSGEVERGVHQVIGAVVRGKHVAQPDPVAGDDLRRGPADHVGVGETVAIEVQQRHPVDVDDEARHDGDHEEPRIPLHQRRVVLAREPLTEMNDLHRGQQPRRREAEDPQ